MLSQSEAPRRAELTARAAELARPKLPLAMRALGAAASPLAGRLWEFDPEELKRKACAKTELADFGDDAPLDEPLEVLCRSLRTETRLSTSGRFVMYNQLLGSLVNRLRLRDLEVHRPEIFEAAVPSPLFVTGTPRTGTTFVQKLLWQDSGWRSLLLWEASHPLPAGDLTARQPDPDPRIASSRNEVRLTSKILPEQASIHGSVADEPEEENPLLAIGHCSSMYENIALVPGYREWYTQADHTAGYRQFRQVLRYLQWSRPGAERWALKAPGHLEMMGPLQSAFPDATVVRTHRDPVTSVISFANMVTYGARVYFDRPDPHLVGRYAADFVERLLRAAVRDHDPDDGRVVDIRFRDLITDPLGEMKRVYEAADRELDSGTERAMREYAESESRRGGRNRYAAEDFALDLPALRERFGFYYDHFDVAAEHR
ncbi:sulfotransferase family protein [Streptomyces oceani]|uniref:sulfotransferase family protein n=1 Tax=Streptomyces oceani TaxID=1075402 RepID=UPI000872DB30|nr:sulfotransferase [Streptomyces oceani]